MSDAQKYTSKLHSHRILIIGGTSGIGYAVAEASLEHGAHVIISSSSPQRIQSALSSLRQSYPSTTKDPDRLQAFPCDLASPAVESNLTNLLSHCCPTSGGDGGGDADADHPPTPRLLDHIVFTAGDKLAIGSLSEISLEAIHRAGQVRFAAPLLLAKLAPRYLAAGPRSSITLTTGAVSEKPIADWTLNGAYGAGSHGLMRGIALDLRPVRCNLVSPGLVDTEMFDNLKAAEGGKRWEEFSGKWARKMTTGRVGRREDVAE